MFFKLDQVLPGTANREDSHSQFHFGGMETAMFGVPRAIHLTESNYDGKLNSRGGVAQLVRAHGSYPCCHWFDSSRRHHPVRNKNPRRHGRGFFLEVCGLHSVSQSPCIFKFEYGIILSQNRKYGLGVHFFRNYVTFHTFKIVWEIEALKSIRLNSS